MFALERKMRQHPYYMATDPRPSDSIIESCNFYLAHSQKNKKHVGFTKSESYKSQLLPSAQPPDTTFQGLIRLKPTASSNVNICPLLVLRRRKKSPQMGRPQNTVNYSTFSGSAVARRQGMSV